jgi:cysteine desulfurase
MKEGDTMESIYLDHAATAPTHPEVVQAMIPYFSEQFGNPSSIHRFGRSARHALDLARETIAQSIGASSNEIVFTSGGTEADNLALIGAAIANRDKGNHIITTEIEHHAILHTSQYLETNGFRVTYLPVDETGRISVYDLEASITDQTTSVSVMFGNNEVGTLQPIREIGDILQDKDIYFHTDAVQAYGISDVNVNELNLDLMSVSAHKINGPKGVGFLYIRDGVKLNPSLYGGEQEKKRRAGTENVPAIIGMQKAVELLQRNVETKREQYSSFRNRMIEIFREENISFQLNGNDSHFLPHILNVSFEGVKAEPMLINLDLSQIAVSSGSACTAGSVLPSHVLAAMFDDEARILSAVRFSFGYGNTLQQVEHVARETARIVRRINK